MYEVEIKYPLADASRIKAALTAVGGRFEAAVEQADRYYAHPCRDFAVTDEALRLRREGDAVVITWKGPRIDASSKTRREIELPLLPPGHESGGSATLEAWGGLLAALGFRAVREVVKSRHWARVPWEGREVVAAIDRVAGLGSYLELELMAEEAGVAEARRSLETLARELGCGNPERRSYLELLLAESGG